MIISEKIKAINSKVEQNKVWYDLDKKSAKISTLLSKIVNKYELSTGKDVLPEKRLAQKSYYNETIWLNIYL